MQGDSGQCEADQSPHRTPGRAFDIACGVKEIAELRRAPLSHKRLEFRRVPGKRGKEPGIVGGSYADKGPGRTVRGTVLSQRTLLG